MSETADGITAWFKVLVGLHPGSVLSPLMFNTTMEVTSREITGGLPWNYCVQTNYYIWRKVKMS